MGCEEYREQITGLLYDELTDVEARTLAAHLERCTDCRAELDSLREVRRALATWHVPSFSKPHAAWTPPAFFWGFAAAAVLVVGMGVAVGMSGLEVRIGREPLVVALGRPPAADTTPAIETAAASPAAQQAPAVVVPAVSDSPKEDACMQRAQALLTASEARQSAAVQASLADLERRLVAQRQYDLARMSAGLSYLEGKTGQDMARTTELMGQILRVSGDSER